MTSGLKENNIVTGIHYPIPIHLQPAAHKLGYKKGDFPKAESQAKELITLPVHQYLGRKQLSFLVKKINNFYQNK